MHMHVLEWTTGRASSQAFPEAEPGTVVDYTDAFQRTTLTTKLERHEDPSNGLTDQIASSRLT